jgi:hypothetical protein
MMRVFSISAPIRPIAFEQRCDVSRNQHTNNRADYHKHKPACESASEEASDQPGAAADPGTDYRPQKRSDSVSRPDQTSH